MDSSTPTPAESLSGGAEEQDPKRQLKKILPIAVVAAVTAAATAAGAGFSEKISAFLFGEYEIETLTNIDQIDAVDKPGGEYLFPVAIQDIGSPPGGLDTCTGRYLWAREKKAIDASSTLARIAITAKRGHNLQLIAVDKVPMEEPTGPSVGSMVTCGGKGGPPVRHVALDLDTGRNAYFDGEGDEPKELNLSIDPGKTEVVDVLATTERHHWSYKVKLTLLVDGKREEVLVDDDGRPFQTTGSSNARFYRWANEQWFDVTPGSGGELPAPNVPVTLPNACSIVSQQELKGVLGKSFKVHSDFPSEPSTTENGRIVVTSFCNQVSPDLDSVQVSLTEARDAQEAGKEFTDQLKLIDPENKAKDLAGFEGAKSVGHADVVFLKGTRILRVNITRSGNEANRMDQKHVITLARIGLDRL